MNWNKLNEEWRQFVAEKLAAEEQSKRKEIHIRELQTELEVKEVEIKHLSLELEEANKERFDLRKKFTETSNSLKIYEVQLNLSNKKRKMLHEEMDNKRDMMVNEHVMYQSAITELKSVKEQLEKSQIKERELSRELEIYQTKYKHNSLHEEEMDKKETGIKYETEVLKRGMDDIKNEQFDISEVKNHSKLVKEFMETLILSLKNYDTIKNHVDFYMKQFHDVYGKYTKLIHLIQSNTQSFQSSLPMQQLVKQWTADIKYFREVNEKTCDMVSQIIKEYTTERSLNCSLILRIEQLEELSALAQADKRVTQEMDEIIRLSLRQIASDSEIAEVLEQDHNLENKNDLRKATEESAALEANIVTNTLQLENDIAIMEQQNVNNVREENNITSNEAIDMAHSDVSNMTTFAMNKHTDTLQNDTSNADNANQLNKVANDLKKAEATKDSVEDDADDSRLVEICKAFENVNALHFELTIQKLRNENLNLGRHN